MAASRSISVTNKELQQIKVLAGFGLSIPKIALVLGISESTFYRRKRLLPAVKEAYEQGIALAEYAIAKTLYDMATVDRNLGAIIWWEKTRFGRSDRPAIETVDVTENQPQIVLYLPENERDLPPPKPIKIDDGETV